MRTTAIAVLLGLALALTLAGDAEPSASQGGTEMGTIERKDPRFDKLVPASAKLMKVAEGFIWVEGPVWVKDGGYLLFSDIPNNVVNKYTPKQGVKEFLKPSGYTGKKPRGGKPGDEPGSNGLTLDPQGRLVLCEHGDRQVSRIEKEGKKKGLPDGMKIDQQGNLFATGPGGVLVFTPDGTYLGSIDPGVPTANCAFGEDGTVLYVAADRALCRIQTSTKGKGF